MPCDVCPATEALATCALCARTVCDRHRATTDGLTACSACVEAEHARRERARAAAEALAGAAAEGRSGRGLPGVASAPSVAHSAASPPAPLAEPPPVFAPVALGGLAGAATLAYSWWLLDGVARDGAFAAWAVLPAATTCAAFAFVGVWIIVRVRWPRAGERAA